jgi:hypothetical protein
MATLAAALLSAQGGLPPSGLPPGGFGRGGLDPGQGRGPARAQPVRPDDAPRGTSILRGSVVASDTGAPIRRAQVRAFSADARESRLASTDAQGRWEIKDLPAGRYTITAAKGGFVTLQYGQRRPSESGTPVELGDAQAVEKIVIALPHGSVLGGRITDEFGEPVANAVVVAMRYAYQAGARRLVPATGANSRDTTDDQGAFRLFGLPPGDYYVSAMLRAAGPDNVTDPMGEPSGYAPTYYPGTPNVAEAARVTVGVSQENNNVSFGLIATRLVKVSGLVMTSSGAPANNGTVMLLPADAAGRRGPLMGGGGGGGRLDANGGFRLNNVTPGRYQVQARSGLRADGELAKVDLTVGTEDVEGLVMITRPPARATGTVVSDSGEPLDFRPQQMQVVARVADPEAQGMGAGGGGRVNPDWTFELQNLTDARLIRVGATQGWTLKTVTLNGEDITDTPVEFPPGQMVTGLQVVLTRKVSSLSGAVTDIKGQPVLDATVVVFPSDDRLWTFQSRYIRAARPDQSGQYRITALPPSDSYLAIALQGLEDGQAGDPEFLASIRELAARFALGDGEQKGLDVRLSTRR